jgi:hypothetical protein
MVKHCCMPTSHSESADLVQYLKCIGDKCFGNISNTVGVTHGIASWCLNNADRHFVPSVSIAGMQHVNGIEMEILKTWVK